MKTKSPVGKVLKKLRFDNEETQRDMARRLGVSGAHISCVETGISMLSERLQRAIVDVYQLNDHELEELKRAIVQSKKDIKIKIENLNTEKRMLIYDIGEKIEKLTSQEVAEISKILEQPNLSA